MAGFAYGWLIGCLVFAALVYYFYRALWPPWRSMDVEEEFDPCYYCEYLGRDEPNYTDDEFAGEPICYQCDKELLP